TSLPGNAASLIARIQAGDERAFQEMFLASYDKLCRFAATFVHAPEIAEELVQDVFTRVWARRASLHLQESLRAYLYAAVRNECLMHARRERMRRDWRQAVWTGEHRLPMGTGPMSPDRFVEAGEIELALGRAL